jgi:hypothetical protein
LAKKISFEDGIVESACRPALGRRIATDVHASGLCSRHRSALPPTFYTIHREAATAAPHAAAQYRCDRCRNKDGWETKRGKGGGTGIRQLAGRILAEYLPNTYRIFTELPTEAVVKSVDNCCCGTPGI